MALNVLIVDDSSLTRKRIRRIIEMVDLEVGRFLEAGNGVEALRILGESRVDRCGDGSSNENLGGYKVNPGSRCFH
jgi:DNA-binding LytR/AlgR family response regulator